MEFFNSLKTNWLTYYNVVYVLCNWNFKLYLQNHNLLLPCIQTYNGSKVI